MCANCGLSGVKPFILNLTFSMMCVYVYLTSIQYSTNILQIQFRTCKLKDLDDRNHWQLRAQLINIAKGPQYIPQLMDLIFLPNSRGEKQ